MPRCRPFAVPDVYGKHLWRRRSARRPARTPSSARTSSSAWLCGGRFIELKTVQILDELEIPRPCIDMEDEGYNVEWSQELKLEESAHEYIVAWALVHILPRILGWRSGRRPPCGTIFDMSVGYNLEGIQSPRVRATSWTRWRTRPRRLPQIKAILRRDFPQFADVEIPDADRQQHHPLHHARLPARRDRARSPSYLLTERKLHTIVKMNPTLLGKEQVLDILHNDLGFHEIDIPDSVFEHDIAYDKAVGLIAPACSRWPRSRGWPSASS